MTRIRLDDLTSDQLDALYDELEAYRKAPVLRHCLVPGCLREYDARATLAGQPPAHPHTQAMRTVKRVYQLRQRWLAAGPPPLGTPVARWWDRRLSELGDALAEAIDPDLAEEATDA